MNKWIIRLEGLTIFLLCIIFYHRTGSSWLWFLVFLFVPDVSALGYIFGIKIGAITYNIVHTYVLSLILLFTGVLVSNQLLMIIGLIGCAHIAMDRMIGYGLKYTTGFKDTHLDRL